MTKELSDKLGLNYEAALDRCMGNEALYERLLTLFVRENILLKAKECKEANDLEQLYAIVHDLKGSSGNLGFSKLFELATRFCSELKNHDTSFLDQHFAELENCYNSAQANIKEYLNNK